MLMEKERQQVADYGRKLIEQNLTSGTSGNISIYDPDTGLMCIKPSGMGYFDIKAEDVVVMDLEGHIIEGERKPSSEHAMHAMMYKLHPEARSVVHTHSLYCTIFACLHRPIQAVHYVIADCNSHEIPCADYATYGTDELAEKVKEIDSKSEAILLANHGIITFGKNIESAFGVARNAEWIAKVQWHCEAVGKPNILSKDEIGRVIESFSNYGQSTPVKH